MITLVAGKFHPQMNIVVMMLDVFLPSRRIVAIRAEMKNLVVLLCHVPPQVAWVRNFFWHIVHPYNPSSPFLEKVSIFTLTCSCLCFSPM